MNGPSVVGALVDSSVGVLSIDDDDGNIESPVVGSTVVSDAVVSFDAITGASVWLLKFEFCVQFLESPISPKSSSQIISYFTSTVILLRAGLPLTSEICETQNKCLRKTVRHPLRIQQEVCSYVICTPSALNDVERYVII